MASANIGNIRAHLSGIGHTVRMRSPTVGENRQCLALAKSSPAAPFSENRSFPPFSAFGTALAIFLA
jgi:hypothetical protein